MNYYNEIDPYAAQWLRNLIAAGHIAAGDVDERSIVDVAPSELAGYTQCHFFAGIGVWSLALRRAGWADDRPIWTGSCPCQPFSAAGKGAGFDDERHLWPAFHHLIEQCRPAAVLGEQVASKGADPWINLVQADLEALGYAFGCVAFPSAGIGAPHIRDRAYWVAHADGSARGQRGADLRGWTAGSDAQPWAGLGSGGVSHRMANTAGTRPQGGEPAGQRVDAQHAAVERTGSAGGMADADRGQFDGVAIVEGNERVGHDAGRTQECGESQPCGDLCGVGNPDGQPAGRHAGGAHATQVEHGSIGGDDYRLGNASSGISGGVGQPDCGGFVGQRLHAQRGVSQSESVLAGSGEIGEHDGTGARGGKAGNGVAGDSRPGPTNGFWRDADWLLCRDGKWRPVEPGTFPLVDGSAGRVGRVRADQERIAAAVPRKDQGSRAGRLKGYGNAINAEAARVWIETVMECIP